MSTFWKAKTEGEESGVEEVIDGQPLVGGEVAAFDISCKPLRNEYRDPFQSGLITIHCLGLVMVTTHNIYVGQ